MQEVTVKQILAMLLQTQHGINFTARFARQDASNELHVGRWHIHIDHEVGTCERKQDGDMHVIKQHRVQNQFTILVMNDRDHKRHFLVAVDTLTNDVSRLVTEEQAR